MPESSPPLTPDDDPPMDEASDHDPPTDEASDHDPPTDEASDHDPPTDEASDHDSPTDGASDDELSSYFRPQDPRAIVEAFVRGYPGPMTNLMKILSTINHYKLRDLIKRLINTFADSVFRNRLLRALKHHIATHPWQTAFFVVGIVLICNPIALAGFGALGPVAGKLLSKLSWTGVATNLLVGSFAASWQASIGSVAAGSAFATLQSIGMVGAVTIPATGIAIAGAAVASMGVSKLVNGEYGKPVKDWWEKNYNWWRSRGGGNEK
jgi:hypothetical protein